MRMQTWMRQGVVAALVILVSGCATTSSSDRRASRPYEEIKTLKQEIKDKDETIEALEAEIASLKAEEAVAAPVPAKAASKKVLSIRQAQRVLKELGYYEGTVDGKDGKATRRAIKDYQAEHNLKADGILGPKTSDKLSVYNR